MASKQKVLLIGATGNTGRDVLEELLGVGNLEVIIFSRSQSASSDKVQQLRDRGLKVVDAPSDATARDLAAILQGIDVVVSAVGPQDQLDQFKWIDAAKEAGVKRFVPCGFTTICPRGDVMLIRDEKEAVHDYLFKEKLPYTIIDVGYWYQISFPKLPSGKVDYAVAVPLDEVYAGGDAPNLLVDKRDIGKYVARIISDPRTLNKRVIAYGEELSQNQITEIIEKLSGEKLALKPVSAEELRQRTKEAVDSLRKAEVKDFGSRVGVYINQYKVSKFVRADNTLQNANYLGYMDAHELYHDFKPTTFEHFFQETLDQKGQNPFA